MKRMVMKFSGLSMALIMVFSFVCSKVYAAEDTIKGISISNEGILTWDAYEGADKYWVNVYDEYEHNFSSSTEEASYSLYMSIESALKENRFTESLSYTVEIEAWSDTESTILAKSTTTYIHDGKRINNLQVNEGGILTWDAYSDADKYDVTIYGADKNVVTTIAETSIDLDSWITNATCNKNLPVLSEYSIEVKALKTIGGILAWNKATYEYEAKTLDNISISDVGLMTWNAYVDATKYDVTIYAGDKNISTSLIETNVDLRKLVAKAIDDNSIPESFEYTIEIKALNKDEEILAWNRVTYEYKTRTINDVNASDTNNQTQDTYPVTH